MEKVNSERSMPIIADILGELTFAVERFPKFHSEHEGYAVILEELDELWDNIKNNKHTTIKERRKEAVQVAAMAVRYVYDLCDKDVK